MKYSGVKLLAMSAAIMAQSLDQKIFDMCEPTNFGKKAVKVDLPRWSVNGHVIYAKDAKTAIKYAKKRGLWSPGTEVKQIES